MRSFGYVASMQSSGTLREHGLQRDRLIPTFSEQTLLVPAPHAGRRRGLLGL